MPAATSTLTPLICALVIYFKPVGSMPHFEWYWVGAEGIPFYAEDDCRKFGKDRAGWLKETYGDKVANILVECIPDVMLAEEIQ